MGTVLAACSIGGPLRARAQPRSTAQSGATTLHLLRTGDLGGLPAIDLVIDGLATRWLVDSGATTSLVSPPLAARLGLGRLPPVRVATAGGVQTLDRFRLPALPVLGLDEGTSVVAMDLEPVLGAAGAALDGLLGAPWLRDRVTQFDFAGRRLRWSSEPHAAGAAEAEVTLPLTWDAGLPVLRLAIGAREPDRFLLDTGNAGALVVFAARSQRLLVGTSALPALTVQELGGPVSARYARIEVLAAPGYAAAEVPAAFEEGGRARRGGHFDRLAGSLGVALFEAGALTIDGPGARLVIAQPGLPAPPPLPGGFGLVLARSADRLLVAAVLGGGPAAAAGVVAGDVLASIDGSDTRSWTPAQAWQALAGRDRAHFELQRAGSEPARITLARARFFPLLR